MAPGSVQSATFTNGGISSFFMPISFLIGGQVNEGDFTWSNQFFKVFLLFVLYWIEQIVLKTKKIKISCHILKVHVHLMCTKP